MMRNIWVRLIIFSTLFSSMAGASGDRCELLFKSRPQTIEEKIAALSGPQRPSATRSVRGDVITDPGLPEIIVDQRARDRFQGTNDKAFKPTRGYDLIDPVVVDLISAIQSRLPRRIDAYRFDIQDRAYAQLDVPEIGPLTIEIFRSQAGLTNIYQIEGAGFRITNLRPTGRTMRTVDGRKVVKDSSLPHRVLIGPLDLEIGVSGEDGGVYVRTKGRLYSNNSLMTLGRWNPDQIWNDELLLAYDLPDTAKSSRENYLKALERAMPGTAKTISLREVESRAAAWLLNVTEAMKQLPIVPAHIRDLQAEEPVPSGFETLVAWTTPDGAKKLRTGQRESEQRFANESVALNSGTWPIPTFPKGQFAEINPFYVSGFVFLHFPDSRASAEHGPSQRLSHLGRYEPKGQHSVQINVHLKSGDEVFVGDLNSKDASALENSMRPASQYQTGMFANPIIMVRRSIDFSEIEISD